ncbi:MAG: pyridoxamine 5'-phosphate oxidase family protein [Coriobacteriia bacterium]|nr:pyridoxamine 5'-phosphate oxidase family protein [Coriobacteriia bacterium]
MSPFHLRRADRALTEASVVDSVLRRGRYAAIAMVHEGEPYVVTLSYGHDADRGALYFHVAPEGRKIAAMREHPGVCATVVIDGGYEEGACKHHYESVVITGTMALVEDPDEARHGMRILLGHLEADPGPVWERNRLDGDAVYERMRVARLDIDQITGKAGS